MLFRKLSRSCSNCPAPRGASILAPKKAGDSSTPISVVAPEKRRRRAAVGRLSLLKLPRPPDNVDRRDQRAVGGGDFELGQPFLGNVGELLRVLVIEVVIRPGARKGGLRPGRDPLTPGVESFVELRHAAAEGSGPNSGRTNARLALFFVWALTLRALFVAL